MNKKNPYKSFQNYILRTPLFSFSSFKNITSKRTISDDDFKKICNDPIIKEALFLASPSLYQEINRWLNDEIKDNKKEEKLKFSVLKYFSRMSSRCTPFGLFAGCSVGKIENETNIKLNGANNNKRHTRLDMNYLVALSQDLIKNKKIREQLLFYPNSSIYKTRNEIRYIEYKYFNSKRQHHIVAVDDTEHLDIVLSRAVNGALLKDLAQVLVNDEIAFEEAFAFIEELISSQLIISELEPSISGPEFLDQISLVLNRLNNVDETLDILQESHHQLNSLDKTIGNNPQKYLDLSNYLKKLETDFDLKFMFQTDMVLNNEKNTIDKELISDLKKGLSLLNKISLPPQITVLTNFKDAFLERFEEREVLLSNALDVEIGLGYIQGKDSGDINPLVDNIVLPRRSLENSVMDIKWTRINALFQKKLMQAFKDDSYIITLNDDDFKDYDASWDDLPDTISCMVEVLDIEGKEKLKFSSGGGSSAANLLGRFCHGNRELYDYTKEIINVETKINRNKILAEIIHLPESRVGNILMRPDFRKYEIPYLAKSIKSEEHQLPLDDLMISVKNHKKIQLRSKKYDKEVIPRLTNAHNYSYNSLPIYHFLADMQMQGLRSGVAFNLGPFASDYEFLPRIEYHNLILSEATWNLKKIHIEQLLKQKNDDSGLLSAINAFRKNFQIPQYTMLSDGDNELLINFRNLTSVRMLLNTISKRSSFKIKEFLFSDSGIVMQGKEYYTNQIIISFYNEEKLKNSSNEQ